MPRALDLFSGPGNALHAFKVHGWEVITVDNDPRWNPTHVHDLTTEGYWGRFDLVWASPPCAEFSRQHLPWYNGSRPPNLAGLYWALHHIIRAEPHYWVIENVRGAIPYLGPPALRVGHFYLWGSFPHFPSPIPWMEPVKTLHRAPHARARIPYALSLDLYRAISHLTIPGVLPTL